MSAILETLFEPNGDSSGKKIKWSNEMNELRNENKTTHLLDKRTNYWMMYDIIQWKIDNKTLVDICNEFIPDTVLKEKWAYETAAALTVFIWPKINSRSYLVLQWKPFAFELFFCLANLTHSKLSQMHGFLKRTKVLSRQSLSESYDSQNRLLE